LRASSFLVALVQCWLGGVNHALQRMCVVQISLDPASKNPGQLICRANPPVMAAIPVPAPNGINVQMIPMWAVVQKDDWCGCFEDENDRKTASN
jgi:hypothetical protein